MVKIVLGALLLGGIGNSCTEVNSAPNLDDLQAPAVALYYGHSLCQSVIVLDHDREVWFDTACESVFELESRGWMDSARLAELNLAFDSFPEPSTDIPTCNYPSEGSFTIIRVSLGDIREQWRGCMPADGLPTEPFETVYSALITYAPK